jgi:hypothetical protein
MKVIRYMLLAVAVIAVFTVATSAQKRTTTKRSTKTSTPKTSSTMPPLDVRAAREKVSNQHANVGAFLERLGPVAQAIEAVDAEAKTNAKTVKQESITDNEAAKQKVIAAIRNLREGMVKLESEFRVKPVLKKYLANIQGISDLAGQAETSAIAGKFVAANSPLRSVQQKLTDTLAAMPNVPL